ncbi:MAG: hypothetical protein WCQ99_12120, partial [Pseudomonadota bacterium]
MVSAGFGETGKTGLALERRIKKVLRDYPMRVVGPNCLGIIRPSVGLNASFLTVEPAPGDIALISQSGALGAAMLDMAGSFGVGISKFASLGNKALLDESALLEYLATDRKTKVIAIYAEDLRSPDAIKKAAYAGAPCFDVTLTAAGNFSYQGISSFAYV